MAGALLVIAPAASGSAGGFAVTRIVVGRDARSVAADPVTHTIYAAYLKRSLLPGLIAVIDGATDTVTASIHVAFDPSVITVDPTSDTVYAVGEFPATMAVISGATNAVTHSISLPSGALSIAAAVNPVTDVVYVADYAHATVIVVNGSSGKVTATIPLTDPVHAPHPSPRGIAVDTATNRVYVSDDGDNQIAVINGVTNAVTSRIALPADSGPAQLAADPGTGRVYVVDQGHGAISVIKTATSSVSTLVTGMGDPFGVALNPTTGTLYATSRDHPDSLGTTYVIDTASRAITASIGRGGSDVTVDPSSGSAYVTNGTSASPVAGSVTVITPSASTTIYPVIVSFPAVTFTTGQAGQDQLQASATPAASFAATGLPAGLTLTADGLLSGTPARGTGGFYEIPVTASNGVTPADTELFALRIYQPPAITSPGHATFRTGVAGSVTVTTSGFPTATFSETGALPRGVTLSPAGILSGTPARRTGGRYRIQLTAANGVGSPATQAFTLTVDQPPSFISPSNVTFTAGRKKTIIIATKGFPVAQLTESGKLPKGITFRAHRNGTATLSGTAARSAKGRTFKIVVAARNGVGPAARQTLTIRVR